MRTGCQLYASHSWDKHCQSIHKLSNTAGSQSLLEPALLVTPEASTTDHSWGQLTTSHSWGQHYRSLKRSAKTSHSWGQQYWSLKRSANTSHSWGQQYWSLKRSANTQSLMRPAVPITHEISSTSHCEAKTSLYYKRWHTHIVVIQTDNMFYLSNISGFWLY